MDVQPGDQVPVSSRYWLHGEHGAVIEANDTLIQVEIATGVIAFRADTHRISDLSRDGSAWFIPVVSTRG